MKKDTLTEFIRYALVGGICTILDFLTLYLLTTLGGLRYLLSSSLSFVLGVVLNWLLCTYWIFAFHKIKQQAVEFFYYVLISLVGLGLNVLLMWLFTDICGVWFMLSKLMAAVITLFYNFFARKLLLHNS